MHQKEIMPQFARQFRKDVVSSSIATGVTLFAFGLFKKVMIADSFSPIAQAAFALASSGEQVNFFYAWKGALAYTLQLYFDFSGYSDMAMGLGFLFGIKLPLNFNSPIKLIQLLIFGDDGTSLYLVFERVSVLPSRWEPEWQDYYG